MAMGVEPSVPSAQSTGQITTSPACALFPDLAERIFSLMVWPAIIRRRTRKHYEAKRPGGRVSLPGGGARLGRRHTRRATAGKLPGGFVQQRRNRTAAAHDRAAC